MESTVVAAVEFDLDENFAKLPSPVVVVWVYIDDRLTVDVFPLRWLMDPAKKSMAEPGRPLNRFREIASRPNMATRERLVGVEGIEFLPVLNSKSPNWWTDMVCVTATKEKGGKNLLVCTTRFGMRSVWTISSSASSSGSLDETEYRQSPPAKGCTRIRAKGGAPIPNGIGSAEPKGST